MHEIVIDRPASEASALLAIRNPAILEAHGWEAGFWTCSDEDPVEQALGALGRRISHEKAYEEWELKRLSGAKATARKKTEDCEAMARQGDWVYIFGSHYGLKTGPLKPRRSFVARFNEARVKGSLDDTEIPVEIARGAFKIHRILNDALKASGLPMIEAGAEEASRCIADTRKKGRKKGKRWARRIQEDDWPVNVEGVAFRPSGTLLLGLRYPVSRDGHPIVAEIDDVGKLFRDPPLDPAVLRLWVLTNVGSAREPRGVRALEDKGTVRRLPDGGAGPRARPGAPPPGLLSGGPRNPGRRPSRARGLAGGRPGGDDFGGRRRPRSGPARPRGCRRPCSRGPRRDGRIRALRARQA